MKVCRCMACMLAENFCFTQGAVVGGEELHAAAEKNVLAPRALSNIAIRYAPWSSDSADCCNSVPQRAIDVYFKACSCCIVGHGDDVPGVKLKRDVTVEKNMTKAAGVRNYD